MSTTFDYSKLIVTKPGRPYSQESLTEKSHYNDQLTVISGVTGNSRVWGDASYATQKASIDALISASKAIGFNDRQTALVLAMARVESGFNPSAASNQSAVGLGQSLDGTRRGYGLVDEKMWDINGQAKIMVQHVYDLQKYTEKRDLGEEYIYKFYHDGFLKDYGGLNISQNKIMPKVDEYQLLVKNYVADTTIASPIVPTSGKDIAINTSVTNANDLLISTGNWASELKDKIWDWVNNEIDSIFGTSSDSPPTPIHYSQSASGSITTLTGKNNSVTINTSTKTVKIPVTTSLPTGEIGQTSGETGMFTTYNMLTGELLSVESTSPNITTPQNTHIFDLSVDPFNLKPDSGDLGHTSGGWGLLGAGAAYEFSMASPYVNNNGGEFVGSSAIVARDTRVGNGSKGEMGSIMNATRATLIDLADPNVTSDKMLLNIHEAYNNVAYTDPVALDGDGDGVRFSAAPTHFDLNADGTAEALLWTAPTDSLLVMDLNGDGRINNVTELVDLTESGTPLNLFTLDDNADKKLDANDNAYYNLQIWTDRNQDGYASQNELQTLSDLGISSIDLDPAHILTQTVAGKPNIKGVNATYSNGQTRTLWDIPLDTTNTPTSSVTTTAYSASIDKISSNGQTALKAMSSLGVAINLNGSGATQAIGSIGNDTITGTTNNDWLIGGAGADTFNAGDGSDLLVIDAEDQQANINAGAGIDTVLIADDRGVILNLAKAQVEVVYGGYGDDVFIGGGADNYFIDGAAGDDLILGGSADDALSGADGDDIIQGGKGDDLIRGGRDSDQLLGGEGNDVLDGGLGNDTIKGEAGNDVIQASGGTDTVDGGDGVDSIELHGNLEDYSFVKNTDGSWKITDKKNVDGSTVTGSQVSDRDGVQSVKNVEKFSFQRGNSFGVAEFGIANPLAVNDKDSSFIIPIASLTANDIDFQSASNNLSGSALSIYWVGDALGGSVNISGNNIIFTPTENYNGSYEFSYKVNDSQGNLGPVVTNTVDPSIKGELKARVSIVLNGMPDDPDFAKQWYLGATGATQAWKDGYTGKGVNVLVFEPSGIFAVSRQSADLNHPDLIDNKSSNFNDTQYHSTHATNVAGVIAAAKNGIGGVGVAYDATINSIGQNPDNLFTSYRQDLAQLQKYDVVNNSWGGADPWNNHQSSAESSYEHLLNKDAIYSAATSGRNGLGTVLVFGAGNSRSEGQDAGLSSVTANPYTINVGAFNRVGDIGSSVTINNPFSERGANVLISAPGSNIVTSHVQVTTADGVTIGAPTTETQGTSFSTPIVSGIVALMLQANPKLTYRDVQTILAVTAKKDFGAGTQASTTWFTNKELDWNGKGMHFSHDFGFGAVDAAAAVNMAETWMPKNDALKTIEGSNVNGTDAIVPDQGSKTLNFNVTENVDIEHVILNLSINHERWGDLVVKLVSPNDTTSILLDRPGVENGQVFFNNPTNEITFNNDLMSVHFRGESSVGTWQLIVEDKAAGFSGSKLNASLQIFGSDPSGTKRYYLTDEYAGAWNLSPDANVMTELNGSALTKAMKVDLNGGSQTNSVNGKSFNLSAGIDRLVGGSGNDTLIGGAGNEEIAGGQGDDSITGGSGSDKLVGGQGDDSLFGGAGRDVLVAGAGTDSLTGDADSDIFVVEGDLIGTTFIKDFNIGTNGDFLRIRTKSQLSLNDISQNIVGNNLELTFSASGSTHKVVFENVKSEIDSKQLIVLPPEKDIQRDYNGNFTEKNLIDISTIFKPVKWLKAIQTVQMIVYNLERYEYGHLLTWKQGTELDDLMLVKSNNRVSDFNTNWIDAEEIDYSHSNPQTNPKSLMRFVDDHIRPLYDGKGGNDEIIGGAESEDIYGGSGQDTINGGNGYDLLDGGSGDDTLFGGDNDDTLIGSSGLNILDGGNGSDLLFGGDDSDTYVFNAEFGVDSIQNYQFKDELKFINVNTLSTTVNFASSNSLEFTSWVTLSNAGNSVNFGQTFSLSQILASNITLYRTSGVTHTPYIVTGVNVSENSDLIVQEKYNANTINSLGGNDVIFAQKNNSLTIDAGQGDDVVYALAGGNVIRGGDGHDRIEITASSSTASDTIYGGAGYDKITTNSISNSYIYGDAGEDTIISGSGDDTLFGGTENDSISAGSGNDVLYGESGVDFLYGDGGNDKLYGGTDNDRLYGGVGQDTLDGGDDNDYIFGGDDNDFLYGRLGNDDLSGGYGNDWLQGDDGADNLSGGIGNDTLYGGIGNDALSGDAENDYLYGEAGDDVLSGGDGDDMIEGGIGNDYLSTGSGSDIIVLTESSGKDVINGLAGTDIIKFENVNKSSVRFSLLNYGVQVKLEWGADFSNSVILDNYSLTTKLEFADAKGVLKDLFISNGYNPDGSFDYVGNFDTQLVGNVTQLATEIGSTGNDELYGGPKENNAAYWYVLGRGGDDTLASGLKGAILDGGEGNDRIRLSNGVTVIRDTLFGGLDTLQLPEGILPEMLIFSRVANPLEADTAFSYTEYNNYYHLPDAEKTKLLNKLNLTPLEYAIAQRSLSSEYLTQKEFYENYFPGNRVWRYLNLSENDEPNSYQNLIQMNRFRSTHFDTLRIQSRDGKFNADVIGYYDSGQYKNEVDNLIFTTAFDNDGNSIKLSLAEMVKSSSIKDKLVDLDTIMDAESSKGFLDYAYLRDPSGSVVSAKATLGSEKGTEIKGRNSYIIYQNGKFISPLEQDISSPYYSTPMYSSGYYIDTINTNPEIADSGKASTIQPILSLANTSLIQDSTYITVLAMSDVLLGFGGNDTIYGGGAYWGVKEINQYSGNYNQPNYIQSGNKFNKNFPDFFLYENYDFYRSINRTNTSLQNYLSEPFLDKVNGGDGDDTYIYREGDGSLSIISLDIPNAGAGGHDTLNMTDYKKSDVVISSISSNGGFKITQSATSTKPNSSVLEIVVADGVNGEIQVDSIRFSDEIYNIRDNIQSNQSISNYAKPPSSFTSQDTRANLLNDIKDSSAQEGTPSGDLIRVANNKIANGYEGADVYLVDTNIQFAVVQYDKADSIVVRNAELNASDISAYSNNFSTESYGKQLLDWHINGIYPNSAYQMYLSGSVFYSDSLIFTEAGTLKTLNDSEQMYSISNWVSAENNNDVGKDLLVSWDFVGANNQTEKHYLVIADAFNDWGMSNIPSHSEFAVGNIDIDGFGTMGDDYLSAHDIDSDVIHGRAGNDTIIGEADGYEDVFYGNTGNDSLDGAGANDKLYGGSGNDTLIGGSGDDLLDGGDGADLLQGGVGNDVYVIDASDTIEESFNAGFDEIQATISVDLQDYANIENAKLLGDISNLTLTGSSLNNRLEGNGTGTTLKGLAGDDVYELINASDQVIENLNEGIDTIETSIDVLQLAKNVEHLTSLGSGLTLIGNSLQNRITGDAGNNFLDGGFGMDTMIGGQGNDIYVVDNVGDQIIEAANEGYDIAWVTGSYTLNDYIEEARSNSSSSVKLVGNGLNNTLIGGLGDDTLTGGGGNDTLFGGLGDDTYFVETIQDIVKEDINEGNDTLVVDYSNPNASPAELTLGLLGFKNIENLTVTGSGLFNLFGDLNSNILTGNASSNMLNGGLGNDTLIGGTGNDTYTVGHFVGYSYDTWLAAGGQFLTYEDVIYEDDGGAGDIDTIKLNISSGYPDSLDVFRESFRQNDDLVLKPFTRNQDSWDEAGNYDSIFEQVRIKNYFLGTQYQVEKIEFNDGVTLNVADLAYNHYASDDGENITVLAGERQTYAYGGDDIVIGSESNNSISGGDGNDYIAGGLGKDRLSGDVGNDVLIGGKDNDTIITGSGYDVIVFNKGDGQDVINASTGADNTISLGGDFDYDDLSLTKSGNNLILKMGASDQITLQGWYFGTTNKSVVNLQIIADAVERFNFTNLVADFDADIAANATNATNWQLSDELLSEHLTASNNTDAIGGDIAYQYGKNGSLAGMGLLHAQSVLGATNFGQIAQTLNNPTVWQAETNKLA